MTVPDLFPEASWAAPQRILPLVVLCRSDYANFLRYGSRQRLTWGKWRAHRPAATVPLRETDEEWCCPLSWEVCLPPTIFFQSQSACLRCYVVSYDFLYSVVLSNFLWVNTRAPFRIPPLPQNVTWRSLWQRVPILKRTAVCGHLIWYSRCLLQYCCWKPSHLRAVRNNSHHQVPRKE